MITCNYVKWFTIYTTFSYICVLRHIYKKFYSVWTLSSVRELKINAVGCAQLTFEMFVNSWLTFQRLTVLQIYLYIYIYIYSVQIIPRPIVTGESIVAWDESFIPVSSPIGQVPQNITKKQFSRWNVNHELTNISNVNCAQPTAFIFNSRTDESVHTE